ncbi:polysulfide reductase NrfD [Dissulfurirhabdus thermomarina]|uniref:Polysulfide reductase NrfD n=1 Tax=Dissulfurirhabdus thermomarina TaxID=1765737 RepID=A0A6N9TMB3_DISTH|nr:NrfD/PsrC family molybdoenzyme membrane anchor subunit [Dissulfurirhabdus thermomarina]NDY41570.1 polysulfide reductase NrfD [Dissulfurirhabdus thermomarina]NMX22375.1 polysulfide reductase NrfD [Dissulfurirhabdus thermomarina]
MSKSPASALVQSLPGRLSSPPLLLAAVCATVSAVGLAFAGHALLVGHEHTFGTTREVPWGILIASYVFFASLSTGLCIVAALGQVFKIEAFQPFVKRAVFLALAAIMTGLMSISLELENPWRVGLYSFLSPHPESNIWWKSTLYSSYMFFMLVNLVLLLQGRTRAAARFGLLGLVACLAANLNLKADMSIIGARGFWREQYMPVFFLTLAALAGCAAMMFLSWASAKLRGRELAPDEERAVGATGRLALGLLVVAGFFTAWKIHAGLSGATENPEAMDLLVKGAYAGKFWIGEVVLAVALPVVFLLAGRLKNAYALATAGLVSLVGIFFVYYDLVVVGQLVPHFHKYNVVDLPRYFSYTPSLHENMILAGAVFFFLALYLAGEELLSGGRRSG